MRFCFNLYGVFTDLGKKREFSNTPNCPCTYDIGQVDFHFSSSCLASVRGDYPTPHLSLLRYIKIGPCPQDNQITIEEHTKFLIGFGHQLWRRGWHRQLINYLD